MSYCLCLEELTGLQEGLDRWPHDQGYGGGTTVPQGLRQRAKGSWHLGQPRASFQRPSPPASAALLSVRTSSAEERARQTRPLGTGVCPQLQGAALPITHRHHRTSRLLSETGITSLCSPYPSVTKIDSSLPRKPVLIARPQKPVSHAP